MLRLEWVTTKEGRQKRQSKSSYRINLFPKEITVHSGIVWRDKKYCGGRQICENRNIYYQILTFYMTEKWNVSFSRQTLNLNVCFHISCPSKQRIRATRSTQDFEKWLICIYHSSFQKRVNFSTFWSRARKASWLWFVICPTLLQNKMHAGASKKICMLWNFFSPFNLQE